MKSMVDRKYNRMIFGRNMRIVGIGVSALILILALIQFATQNLTNLFVVVLAISLVILGRRIAKKAENELAKLYNPLTN